MYKVKIIVDRYYDDKMFQKIINDYSLKESKEHYLEYDDSDKEEPIKVSKDATDVYASDLISFETFADLTKFVHDFDNVVRHLDHGRWDIPTTHFWPAFNEDYFKLFVYMDYID